MQSQPGQEATGIRTVLFDLDGTLLDTAPDLAYALNRLRGSHGLPPLAFDVIRPEVSHGSVALIRRGFEIDSNAAEFEGLRNQLLDIYRDNLTRHTRLFPGMAELLGQIEQRGMNWGVVTNKPSWLTDPILSKLGLADRAACVVCGDTIDRRKPHPAPMLLACGQAGSSVAECLYVGDAQRDIEAGRNAGMKTLIALFGYIGDDEDPLSWGADDVVEHPMGIIEWIDRNSES